MVFNFTHAILKDTYLSEDITQSCFALMWIRRTSISPDGNVPAWLYVVARNAALKEKYGAAICPVMIPMSDGTGVIDLVHNIAYQTKGGKTAKVAVPAADADKVEEMRMELMEAAAVTEELMEKFLDTMELTDDEIVIGLKAGLAERSVVPVVCGAAMSNVGTEAVLQAVCDYVPAPEDKSAEPVCGFVF